jgi:hypothetical protein
MFLRVYLSKLHVSRLNPGIVMVEAMQLPCRDERIDQASFG